VGVFSAGVEIGDPEGQRFQSIDVLVDTGSSYTALPESMLRELGVQPHARQRFVIADGSVIESEVGQTWIRIDGRTQMTVVVFGDESIQPLLGAVTLEEFGLGVDPLGKRLIPVAGYLLWKREP
jgi:clan AA aspartic protease